MERTDKNTQSFIHIGINLFITRKLELFFILEAAKELEN